ncbi:MAG: hypothetical protein ACPHO8_01555 [Mariniblastus sp.]
MFKTNLMKFGFLVSCCSFAVLLAGCSGGTSVEIVPVSGVLTLRGKPLPNAEIKLVPMADGLDGNFVASGVSDAKGEFTLRLPGKDESGCCACDCKVLVVEGPIPGDRGEDEASIMKAAKFLKSLKNRPIPKDYERLRSTPLTLTISADNPKIEVNLD